MNDSKFTIGRLILFAIVPIMMMFIVLSLQIKALQQVGFTLEVENTKLCNRLFCIGGEVEYNPNLEAYIVRDQSRTYYAGVSVKVGGCGNTASDTALLLTFDQITSSYGLRTKLDRFADDKSPAVHGDFTNTLFKANQCDNRPPYEYKWPNSNEDRGLILDIYENDDKAACACSDPAVCGGTSMSCNDNGYPYKCPFPLQRRDPPHYTTDLGRFSGIRQLSSVEKFETEETKTYTFYVPFNFNVVDGGMTENVHTIKTFAWARMDHWSVPEHVYMWEWNDPGGRIKVAPPFINADFDAQPRGGNPPYDVTLSASVTQTTESGNYRYDFYRYDFNCGNGNTPTVTTGSTSASVKCRYNTGGTFDTYVTITQGSVRKTLGPIVVGCPAERPIYNPDIGRCIEAETPECSPEGKKDCDVDKLKVCENGVMVDKGIVVGECGVECYPLGATQPCNNNQGTQTCI